MQRLWTSILNGVEDSLFAVPEAAEMEAAGGTKPYSLAAWITENADGLPVEDKTTNGDAAAWGATDSVGGLAPGTFSKWKNQKSTYASYAGSSTTASLFDAFDEMYLKTKFDAPPTRQEYFESDNLYRQFIAASRSGIMG